MLTSSYDAASRRTQLAATIDAVADFNNQYSYDARSQMTRVTQSGTDITNKRVDFEYNALGQMTRIDRFEDLAGEERVATTSYGFDSLSRFYQHRPRARQRARLEYGWTYDTLNRVATFTTPDGETVYTYDNTSRLRVPIIPLAQMKNTNTTPTATGPMAVMTSTPITRCRPMVSTRTSMTTKEIGSDLTKTGEYTEYTWDYRNRLIVIDTWEDNTKAVKQKGVRYTYDAFDRRISKEIDENADGDFTDSVDWAEHFIYDGEDIALVFDKNRLFDNPLSARPGDRSSSRRGAALTGSACRTKSTGCSPTTSAPSATSSPMMSLMP
ncbi:MAG: hypothetical protein U1D30_18770 [Planctomycetota bacterium]